ncbi:MAG: DUF917 domain-containing protein [Gammaproteobacteria bacterium]|nr:DUF917 domain-containing protein [Gammaproteobacteria bacterium]
MNKLTQQEAKDIQIGASIMSTGGGGDYLEGFKAIEICEQRNQQINLLGMEDLNPEGFYVSVGIIGSISEETRMPVEKNIELMAEAVKILEDSMNVKFEGIISPELGGITGIAMGVATFLDIPMLDCDATGRAVPYMDHTTFNIVNIDSCPVSIATKYGDAIVINEALNAERLEHLLRAMAVASGNIASTFNPIQGKLLKNSTILSALTVCGKIGKAQRESTELNRDPIESIIKAGQGYVLFKGNVNKDTEWQTKSGFTIGTVGINGIEEFNNQTFKLWYKNEHLISWKNDQSFVTCPDLLCVLDKKTGLPVSNPNCKEGDTVVVLGFKADPIWRTERGIELLNPKVFNYDIEYRPIEELV